jgi:hypothetical protein
MGYLIAEQLYKKAIPLERLCRVLDVGSSGDYSFRQRAYITPKACLVSTLKPDLATSGCTYGSRRLGAAMRAHGLHIGRRRVRRLMRESKLRTVWRRKFVHNTNSAHSLPVWANLLASIRPAGRRALWLAAFLLGVAAGSKYHVLGLLPLFGAALLCRHRLQGPGWRMRSEWPTWLGAAVAFALPCIYWYARNALLTGDPVNPLGGRLLGFTDWNLDDYLWQLQDLRNHAAWPHWALWPGLAAPLLPSLRRVPALRAAWLMAAYMALVWLLSSRFPRYLLPAYPLISWLSAAVCVQLLHQLPVKPGRRLTAVLVALLVLTLGFIGARSIAKSWPLIAPTEAARDAVLQQQVAGYQVWRYLQKHPETKLYQMGLEDSLYYAPRATWGDIFGPWRYRDYQNLAPQPLHHKLRTEGFTALVIHTGRAPTVAKQPEFLQYFELVLVDGEVRLYRLRPGF